MSEQTEIYIQIGGQTVNAKAVPPMADRRFRDQWKLNGSVIELDQGKLAEVKTKLKAQLDEAAETQRMKSLTAGEGQTIVYQMKLMEAQAVRMGETNPANVPLLAASIGVEAATLADCAALIMAKWNSWKATAGKIEQARLAGKKAIDAAGSIQKAAEAFDAVTWPQ
jgi:hypothetical protein